MKIVNALLALCAGLLGGVVSHYLLSQPIKTTAIPSVVAAQKFVLVDGAGIPIGTFETRPQTGTVPSIVLYDALGREIWRATQSVRPLTIAQQSSN